MNLEGCTNLTLLADRIANARILREHHVWEAATALSPDARDGRSRRRFAALMEADALLDAVLLLASVAEPRRSIITITNEKGRWTCSMRSDLSQPAKRYKAEHADLAAAVLSSLLLSFQRTGRSHSQETQNS